MGIPIHHMISYNMNRLREDHNKHSMNSVASDLALFLAAFDNFTGIGMIWRMELQNVIRVLSFVAFSPILLGLPFPFFFISCMRGSNRQVLSFVAFSSIPLGLPFPLFFFLCSSNSSRSRRISSLI